MKLIIRSKQDYKTHVDEYTEEFDCKIEQIQDGFKICFEQGSLQIEKERLLYERGKNRIIVEKNKMNSCQYETEYGTLLLEIRGKDVKSIVGGARQMEISKLSGVVASAWYEIAMQGIEAYENLIEIAIR